MVNSERSESIAQSPYKEFSPGQKLTFTLKTLGLDGAVVENPQQMTIGEVRGGGFFGKVLIPKEGDRVIKTSLPDAWHHLWRVVNWGFEDLPANKDEAAAQLEHLTARIIHRVLPIVSRGKFCTPASYGYTKLTTGYAQVKEKMVGRGPRFDLGVDEFSEFRKAQQELFELALNLGLEQAGQIHPDNPFGMANLWFDPQNQKQPWIWLDTDPAIPHNGWTWPFFHFKSHGQLRHWFFQKERTFNSIHVGYFLSEIIKHKSLFSDEEFNEVMSDLKLYQNLKTQADVVSPHKDFKSATRAAGEVATDLLTERSVWKFLADPLFRKEKLEILAGILKYPSYRAFLFNKNFVLAGVQRAKKEGIISEPEWLDAWRVARAELTTKELNALMGLQVYYIASSILINLIEGSAYLTALFAEDKLETAALGFFLGRVLPQLRPAVTLTTGLITKTDLRLAALISAIPTLGSVLPIPAQVGKNVSRDGKIWHYTVRRLIAKISQGFIGAIPHGGWGTEIEARLWQKFGNKLEKLGRPKS